MPALPTGGEPAPTCDLHACPSWFLGSALCASAIAYLRTLHRTHVSRGRTACKTPRIFEGQTRSTGAMSKDGRQSALAITSRVALGGEEEEEEGPLSAGREKTVRYEGDGCCTFTPRSREEGEGGGRGSLLPQPLNYSTSSILYLFSANTFPSEHGMLQEDRPSYCLYHYHTHTPFTPLSTYTTLAALCLFLCSPLL